MTQFVEALPLDESALCTVDELVLFSGLSEAEVLALVDNGAIAPAEAPAPTDMQTQVQSQTQTQTHRVFYVSCIPLARTARRLRDDFELDPNGLSVAMSLLGRIRDLEARIAAVRALLPARRT